MAEMLLFNSASPTTEREFIKREIVSKQQLWLKNFNEVLFL